jgi:hypothetical protein
LYWAAVTPPPNLPIRAGNNGLTAAFEESRRTFTGVGFARRANSTIPSPRNASGQEEYDFPNALITPWPAGRPIAVSPECLVHMVARFVEDVVARGSLLYRRQPR